jgi:hypothetical protein
MVMLPTTEGLPERYKNEQNIKSSNFRLVEATMDSISRARGECQDMQFMAIQGPAFLSLIDNYTVRRSLCPQGFADGMVQEGDSAAYRREGDFGCGVAGHTHRAAAAIC